MKRPYRGVCMEAFDHILGDNFVIILIKRNVDKPIFFFFCLPQANLVICNWKEFCML